MKASCSIQNCNNPAIEELLLENGEIKSFCKKSYYHSAKGWLVTKKFDKSEKGKQRRKKYRNKPENKEKVRKYHKVYYQRKTEKWGELGFQIFNKSENKDTHTEQQRKRAVRYYQKNVKKERARTSEYRKGLKKINLSYPMFRQFTKSLIVTRNNQCERCSSTKKRLLVHHRKEPYLYPHLITDLSNCFVLCYSCHKIIHINSKERQKFYFSFT